MIIRVTRAKSGLSRYLKTGKRSDSVYTRNDKDLVIPLFGDIDTFEKTEQYLNREKHYKNNYLHITLSFSLRDLDRVYDEEGNIDYDLIRELAIETIKHYTSGYDMDNEVVAYAEMHAPRIKSENGKIRLDHIHIGIALYNPLTDTQLKPPRFSPYVDNLFQTYLAKKYGLDLPAEHPRKEQNFETETGITRKELQEALKDIETREELLQFFRQNNIKYREVKTKRNHYFKILNSKGKDINLRGKGFENLEEIAKYGYVKNIQVKKESVKTKLKKMHIEELEKRLYDFYQKRAVEIDKRRSKKAKEKIRKLYTNERRENAIETLTFQQKLLYKHYKKIIDNIGKGYYVKIDDSKITIKNKSNDIDIEDRGDKIVTKGKNYKEQIKIALDLAEAKGWDLHSITVQGSEDFRKEAYRQIRERIEKKTLSLLEAVEERRKREKQERPVNEVERQKQEREEEKEVKKHEIDISLLKEKLDPHAVLEYAIKHHKLDPNDYEIVDGKINNKTNRQKPKNVIDFLTKELHTPFREALKIAQTIYLQQEKTQKHEQERKEETMPITLSVCKSTEPHATTNWETIQVSKWSELATLMKQYPYSASIFKDGRRKGENVEAFGNVLIFDVDNDPDTPQLTMEQAKRLLKGKGVAAMILPSRSHNKDKNGHIAERFRIIIPTRTPVQNLDKETYREFQQLIAKSLKIADYVDTKALNDKARFYYRSPADAVPVIVKADRAMNIEHLQRVAIERVQQRKAKRERELAKLKEIRANAIKHKKMNIQQNSENLSYANVEKMMSIPIEQLIRYYEKPSKEYKEGNYEYLATSKVFKYSILKNENIAHDFLSDKTYNSLTYLMKIYQTDNVMQIARELERVTGESYTEVNYQAVERAINKALNSAKNDKELEEAIKEQFGVKYCKLEKDTIKIADKEIKLSDINLQKIDLINKFRENRETHKQQQQQVQQRQQQRQSYRKMK